jgi:hypothetical protein
VAAHVRHARLDRAQALAAIRAGIVLDAPWCLIARTVVTRTAALGTRPPKRQTMSKNFSMPMSDPKPDSVTT